MARTRTRREPEPIRITTAPENTHDDLVGRRRRYVFSMSLRVICFVGAIVFDGWLRYVLLLGALVLPYIAVVMANASNPRIEGSDLVNPGSGRRELE